MGSEIRKTQIRASNDRRVGLEPTRNALDRVRPGGKRKTTVAKENEQIRVKRERRQQALADMRDEKREAEESAEQDEVE